MTTDVTNFYPKYPFIHSSPLDPYRGVKFADAIVTKKEFALEKVPLVEPVPDRPGDLLRHQRYVARFLAADTGYDELLLFHEPGTGKTCTSVAVAEGLKASWIKGAIVCAKGDGLNRNYEQELAFTCTAGQYVPPDYDTLTDAQRSYRMRRLIRKFYSFKTFETFAKELSKLSDGQIQTRYENHVFIVDEVHNLREREEPLEDDDESDADDLPVVKNVFSKGPKTNIYAQFFRLFHTLSRRKVVLMSGTPIKDTPEEFASVMNLILPINLQFDSNPRAFVSAYFDDDGRLRPGMRRDMADKIRGRVSYLTAAGAQVERVFVGRKMGTLRHFVVSPDYMSDFQSAAYNRAYAADKQTRSIYNASRQASLFVFPDGSVGPAGFSRYVVARRNGAFEATRELSTAVDTVAKLRRLSGKYARVVELITATKTGKHFVYSQFVNGSGSIVLAKVLDLYGFSQATGTEKTRGRRYALCTHQTASNASILRMINRFNAVDNVDGAFISVLIGSRVLNEGFTLKNVGNIFILTPHWNYAETVQAIARAWRFGSHNELLARGGPVRVAVYQCVSVPSIGTSIDLEMYETSERKDVINRQIERLIKETAFDCPLTVDRNRVAGYDDQRECDYQSCDYVCDGTISSPLDSSTYNLLSDVKRKASAAVADKLQRAFLTRNEYSTIDLANDLPEYDSFQLTTAVGELIESDRLFDDRFGFANFLRVSDDTLFLSVEPKLTGGIFTRFYSTHRIAENGDSFATVLAALSERALPDKVSQLFARPDKTRSLIVKLPLDVQRRVLYGCILARDAGKTDNAVVRDDILDFYSGFYHKQDVDGVETWVVSVYAESLGTTCLDRKRREFIPCSVKPKRVVALKSPIGWYGLYNPTSNDFCLRNATDSTPQSDLRKLTVGRRCSNYEQSVLVDLAARRMLIPQPASYLRSATRRELLDALAANGKTTRPDDAARDDDDIRRIVYWARQKKVDVCEAMKNWFKDRNLLETNFDCGSQNKSRAKFR